MTNTVFSKVGASRECTDCGIKKNILSQHEKDYQVDVFLFLQSVQRYIVSVLRPALMTMVFNLM